MLIPKARKAVAAGALALWALMAQDTGVKAQAASEPPPAVGGPEARSHSGASPAPLDRGQHPPTEAPEPEFEAAPGPPAACPDRGRKIELIV
jgi:hypothetical protein